MYIVIIHHHVSHDLSGWWFVQSPPVFGAQIQRFWAEKCLQFHSPVQWELVRSRFWGYEGDFCPVFTSKSVLVLVHDLIVFPELVSAILTGSPDPFYVDVDCRSSTKTVTPEVWLYAQNDRICIWLIPRVAWDYPESWRDSFFAVFSRLPGLQILPASLVDCYSELHPGKNRQQYKTTNPVDTMLIVRN